MLLSTLLQVIANISELMRQFEDMIRIMPAISAYTAFFNANNNQNGKNEQIFFRFWKMQRVCWNL